MRIAISTGGGDAPGLNAVIRAAVLSARTRGWDVLGIKRGFAGLLGEDEIVPLTVDSVRGIAGQGGTIIKTTNRGSPFAYPIQQPDGSWKNVDRSDELVENARNLGIEAIISIGGDGSLKIAQQLQAKGVRVVSVPKTIDNDVAGTITTFGFDTAVNTAMEAIDKLHTTAESHDRVMVLEVMGREAGFIALHAGVAGTADVILIPEIEWELEKVCDKIMARDASGKRFSIVVVAEGSKPKGGNESIIGASLPGQERRLGGIAERLGYDIQRVTGKETRSMVLGHLQRGGSPTGYDRLLATRFGAAAVQAVADKKWGHMVALQSPHLVTIPIEEVLRETKRVDPKHDIVQTARMIGISFGD
ncbi:ATP-dependent 6-phosphofructokinase [Gemmatimonas sp.]|jgi:phosphofructokinase-like protein|uniref:6-phosphofructokinase n=1 Tax=Gemmatimonas sp. TaxID=1962908 RepID=UPI0022BFB781|nr:ATP-dependent 6-phosphofructokinase [Gemmatimonas sp.]MCA2983289.1 ATP-dependent 6-phosphofructokinase [Gemmatimonas sp.]MCA2987135.1 ATP-dependent 6-phosphofructokinase [Gemmatimonas sp.]MCA2990615.1 ATP-dependent 6-phosphofructokinase [Gemmatimonas sp.]MCA2993343.1 ATP-dependent 6-phosphofructokinase [Gemmatimonas sp.]MCE2952217.1 ATP-dependent 6-phosphofructokinase [Gemmatimonas sp.]